MPMVTEENLCSICGAVLPERHHGINDAWPVSDGECCDACNVSAREVRDAAARRSDRERVTSTVTIQTQSAKHCMDISTAHWDDWRDVPSSSCRLLSGQSPGSD